MPVDVIRPDGTISLVGWEANPHLKLDDLVDETNTDALTNSAEFVASSVNNDEFTISFADLNIGSNTVTQAQAHFRWRAGGGGITGHLMEGANVLDSQAGTGGLGTAETMDCLFVGALSQSQVNDLRFRVVHTGTTPNARVGWVFIYVTHISPADNTMKGASAGMMDISLTGPGWF